MKKKQKKQDMIYFVTIKFPDLNIEIFCEMKLEKQENHIFWNNCESFESFYTWDNYYFV